MGEGLKRAVAAARATRTEKEMPAEARAFLAVLATKTEPATRGQLPCVTSNAQARARQWCRRHGYAREVRRERDDKCGWTITEAGRRALNPGETEDADA